VTLAQRCRSIAALILDVDGVLTSGGITYSADGPEIKEFHVRDGSAIKRWLAAGKRLGLLSGRSSNCTLIRARELEIVTVIQGNPEKLPGFERMLREWSLPPLAVAFMGDDNADVSSMRRCGLAIAVADAAGQALRAAHYITRQRGGHGAVREAIDLILDAQDAPRPDALQTAS
jgi:3-deoxy-D-manno-octulosonate 8-phosphate phosphatase (KDO 8-P phosphatase)